MKKKIALFLSVLSVVLMLGACGTDPTTVDYNGYTYDELKAQATDSATILEGYSKEKIEEQIALMKENAADEAALTIELCEKWVAAMEVAGSYVEVVEDSFVITKSGKTLTTDLVLKFEQRDVTFTLVYNYHDMELTGVTVEPVYSLGEKMVKAALNTVICMSIVFVVLIFISLLISCFKIFPYLEAKKKEKAAKLVETTKPVETQTEVIEQQELSDDTELVAVIAAAIAAYEGTSTSDFVVRSIRRR